MKAENKEWIEANKGYWVLYRDDKTMRNGFDANRALQIVREEFYPNALFCTWCPADIGALITYLYTQYEKI